MAINQSLVKGEGSFSYRAPYDRRRPSYNNPTRGAAKASAPASTGSLESRSVVRGPGIENDEMDASDDADMVTQTQTPLTANARGPRYTEGSMMDLFTGQRTGTKNADYKADQPITDTNTPYLATKGFWGGIDRVLGNKSNELNEAAQQQQGANWDAANKLKDAQNREDTVTNNANTFITGRDAAKVTADKNTATALEEAQEKAAMARATAEEKAAGALAVTQATAAEIANNRKITAEDRERLEAQNNRDTDNLRKDAENVRLRNQALADYGRNRTDTLDDQKTANQQKIDAAIAVESGLNTRQQNALANEVKETSDGTFTRNGTVYKMDPNNPLNMIPINFEKPRGSGSSSGGNIGPGRSPKDGQGGQGDQDQPTRQAQPNGQVSLASKSSKSSPAYLSSDSSPSQDKSLDLNYFNLGNQAPRGLTIKDMQSRFSGANPNAQSPEGLGRERSSRRTSEQLGLDYSEANPNAQSSEGLGAESTQDQLRRSQEPLRESLRFPEGFDFNSQDTNPKTPASSQGNNSESLMRSLGPGLLRAGASVPKFLQDVHNLRIAEPHLDTMSGYSVSRDGRRIEPPEIIQDSIRLGNRRAPEIMQSPEGQYEESAMLEDQYDPRTVIPKEINGRKRTLNDEEQIRIDDEMLRRAKNSRKPSFITK